MNKNKNTILRKNLPAHFQTCQLILAPGGGGLGGNLIFNIESKKSCQTCLLSCGLADSTPKGLGMLGRTPGGTPDGAPKLGGTPGGGPGGGRTPGGATPGRGGKESCGMPPGTPWGRPGGGPGGRRTPGGGTPGRGGPEADAGPPCSIPGGPGSPSNLENIKAVQI